MNQFAGAETKTRQTLSHRQRDEKQSCVGVTTVTGLISILCFKEKCHRLDDV